MLRPIILIFPKRAILNSFRSSVHLFFSSALHPLRYNLDSLWIGSWCWRKSHSTWVSFCSTTRMQSQFFVEKAVLSRRNMIWPVQTLRQINSFKIRLYIRFSSHLKNRDWILLYFYAHRSASGRGRLSFFIAEKSSVHTFGIFHSEQSGLKFLQLEAL